MRSHMRQELLDRTLGSTLKAELEIYLRTLRCDVNFQINHFILTEAQLNYRKQVLFQGSI